MDWKFDYTTNAQKDFEKIKNQKILRNNLGKLLLVLKENPFKTPPKYKKLKGNMGFSRRINKQHRLVYEVDKENHVIKVKSMFGHYDDWKNFF